MSAPDRVTLLPSGELLPEGMRLAVTRTGCVTHLRSDGWDTLCDQRYTDWLASTSVQESQVCRRCLHMLRVTAP